MQWVSILTRREKLAKSAAQGLAAAEEDTSTVNAGTRGSTGASAATPIEIHDGDEGKLDSEKDEHNAETFGMFT